MFSRLILGTVWKVHVLLILLLLVEGQRGWMCQTYWVICITHYILIEKAMWKFKDVFHLVSAFNFRSWPSICFHWEKQESAKNQHEANELHHGEKELRHVHRHIVHFSCYQSSLVFPILGLHLLQFRELLVREFSLCIAFWNCSHFYNRNAHAVFTVSRLIVGIPPWFWTILQSYSN